MTAGREVRAFRRVAEALSNPAAAVFDAITVAAGGALCSQELPWDDRSPFAALPEDPEAEAGGGDAAVISRDAEPLEMPPRLDGHRATAAFLPLALPNAAAPLLTALPQSGEPAPPVFSLRPSTRAGARPAGATFPSRSNPSEDTHGGAASTSRPGTASPATPGAVQVTPPERGRHSTPEAELAWDRTSRGAPWPMPAQPGASAVIPNPSASAPHPAPSLASTLQEVNRLASAVLSAEPSAAVEFALSPGSADPRQPTPEHSPLAPDSLAGAARNGVAHQPVPPSSPFAFARTGGSAAAYSPIPPLSLSSATTARPPAGEAGGTACPTDAGQISWPAAGPARQSFWPTGARSEPDAEWLAELINEVLAEQARRHGVDLS